MGEEKKWKRLGDGEKRFDGEREGKVEGGTKKRAGRRLGEGWVGAAPRLVRGGGDEKILTGGLLLRVLFYCRGRARRIDEKSRRCRKERRHFSNFSLPGVFPPRSGSSFSLSLSRCSFKVNNPCALSLECEKAVADGTDVIERRIPGLQSLNSTPAFRELLYGRNELRLTPHAKLAELS
ncbi:hypothetical protein CEXT_157241 [Caerostris extrusa]|uniref:Uncharacterized protein n=1 Tax=Caerostris extrusa TaxID=172846 RepID=A0AAV4XXA6_CAEEX|nr:hypothetical protein CEXT_157241 [Caerostris extrusa]